MLLNVGTNDAGDDIDLPHAGRRMEALLRSVFEKSPGVTILLSTLIPSRDHDDRVVYINSQFRGVIAKLQAEGAKVELADMHDGFVTKDMLVDDGIHPNYEGAFRMAAVWHTAIEALERRGNWLQEPSQEVDFDDDAAGDQKCEKKYQSGASDPRSGMQIFYAKSGNIKDDGTYRHSSIDKGRLGLIAGSVALRKHRLFAAQLVTQGADRGGERDELIAYTDGAAAPWTPETIPFIVWNENLGDGRFGDAHTSTAENFKARCAVEGEWQPTLPCLSYTVPITASHVPCK